ncbi:hypothetical protein JTB14_025699 [Gonioctena quinquepunctata]|nr:hypothetical protein JTB14_025699 [Gonioctena quinquepunctata]
MIQIPQYLTGERVLNSAVNTAVFLQRVNMAAPQITTPEDFMKFKDVPPIWDISILMIPGADPMIYSGIINDKHLLWDLHLKT